MLVAGRTSFLLLNGLRGLTLFSFLLAIAGTGASMVMTIIIGRFFFFDFLRNLIIMIVCGFLSMTELPLCSNYITESWPLLASSSSLFSLGAAQTVIGVFLLSILNEGPNSRGALGDVFWSLLLSGAVMCIVAGCSNMGSKWLFYDPEFKYTARQMRMKKNAGVNGRRGGGGATNLDSSDPEKANKSPSSISRAASSSPDSQPSIYSTNISDPGPAVPAPTHSPPSPPRQRLQRTPPAAETKRKPLVISSPTLIKGGSPLSSLGAAAGNSEPLLRNSPAQGTTPVISNPVPVPVASRARFLGF